MSLKLTFVGLSLGAAVDQQTGSMSVFEIVEEIRVPQLPIQIQSFVLTLSFHRETLGQFDGRILIHLITPDQQQQMIANGELKIPAEQSRFKAIFRFGAFPVVQYGNHRFVISCLNEAQMKVTEGLVDYEVIQVNQANPVAPPPQTLRLAH